MSDRLAVMAGGRIEQVGPRPSCTRRRPPPMWPSSWGWRTCSRRRPRCPTAAAAAGARWASSSWSGRRRHRRHRRVRVVIRPEQVRRRSTGRPAPTGSPAWSERLVYRAQPQLIRLANGESLQSPGQNQGQPLSWRPRRHPPCLPADALRVLPESSAQGPLEAGAVDGGRTPPASRLPSHRGPGDRGLAPE